MLCQPSVETTYKHLRSAILINDCLPSCDDSLTKFHNGDCRTKVNHNIVIHHSCLDPFAIFAAFKPLIVGKKPVSVTQKLYSPLLRGKEEVNPALRGSAFRESNHRAFRIVAACTIKFLLKLRFWNRLRCAANASEISPCFQILWAEKFEDFDYECLETRGSVLPSKSHSAYRACNGDANRYLICTSP